MSQHLKWIFFLLCLNGNDERSVLPMSSGDVSAFLPERMGSWLCFSPSAVISLKRRRGAMSDRLCLYSPSFQGIWSYWKSGDGWQLWDVCVMPIRHAPATPCVRLHPCVTQPVRKRARGPCSPIHGILVAYHFCSHMTSLPDWFHSTVEGGKIKQMLFEIAATVPWGGCVGSEVGGCLLERWSEGWKWRERESVTQSAPCHVVMWSSRRRCYSINQQSFHKLLLFTARWVAGGAGGTVLFLHDAFEYPCKE